MDAIHTQDRHAVEKKREGKKKKRREALGSLPRR
jgi:hypothetical protein